MIQCKKMYQENFQNHWRTEDLAVLFCKPSFRSPLGGNGSAKPGTSSQGCLRSHSPCTRLANHIDMNLQRTPKCSLLDIAGCWVHVASSLAIILATQLLELPHTSVTVSWSACYPSQRDLNATEKQRAGFSGPWDLASTARTACQICGLSG